MRSSALRKLLASAMLLLSVPALAASQKDVDDRRQPLEDDRRIAGCTNVIDDGSTSPRLRSIAFNNRAIALRHKGQYDQAIQDHNEAIKLTPDFAAAYNSRAIVHSVKGENDLALQDYNEAIRLNPTDAIALQNRGVIYRDKGQFDRAIQDFDAAIKLNPNFVIALNGRCYTNAIIGQLQAALTDCDPLTAASAERL